MKLFVIAAFLAVAAAKDLQRPLIWRSGRIVGGEDVSPGDYGFTARMEVPAGSLRCSAVVIDENTLLTAAHCTDGLGGTAMSFAIGQYNTGDDEGVQFFRSASYVNHEDYNDGNGFSNNDISVVKLDGDIDFGVGGDIAALPTELDSNPDDGTSVTMIGWGRLSGGGALPSDLQFVISDYANDATCSSEWGSSFNSATMICESGTTVGACNGDSGGPMMCEGADGPWLCGVTSWGAAGCSVSRPSVYAQVSHYVDWIADNRA